MRVGQNDREGGLSMSAKDMPSIGTREGVFLVVLAIVSSMKSKLSVTLQRILGKAFVQSLAPYETIPTWRFIDTSWKGPIK